MGQGCCQVWSETGVAVSVGSALLSDSAGFEAILVHAAEVKIRMIITNNELKNFRIYLYLLSVINFVYTNHTIINL